MDSWAKARKASQVIREKLLEHGGQATVNSARGKAYVIRDARDGKSFLCRQLPVMPPYRYEVFDVVVQRLKESGGKARKGNGRNYRLGQGGCTEDTIVGAIGKYYWGKQEGDSVFDPVFVLAAVLEWADIAHNGRGYLELMGSSEQWD